MERGTRLWNRKRGSMPVEIPLATENLLENTGGVGVLHHWSLGAAPCYHLFMPTRVILVTSSFHREWRSGSSGSAEQPGEGRLVRLRIEATFTKLFTFELAWQPAG